MTSEHELHKILVKRVLDQEKVVDGLLVQVNALERKLRDHTSIGEVCPHEV